MKWSRTFGAAFAIVGVAALPSTAHAESQFVTGTGTPLTASANLDFTIIIPKFVYVRIGTGSLVNNATVDELIYNVPAAQVGDGSPISGAGGDLSNGTVTARVIGNNGTITFSSATQGAMENASGDTISWTQMDVSVAAGSSATPLAHPTLIDGPAQTSIDLTPNVGSKVTVLDAQWTFTYKNQNVVPAGTYGGPTQNGRVTYSVSMP
jgi:hypothetical protein